MNLIESIAELWRGNRGKILVFSLIWLLATYPIAGPIMAGANPVKLLICAPPDPGAAIVYYSAQAFQATASQGGIVNLAAYGIVTFVVMFYCV